MRYIVKSKEGKAVKLPDELYTEGLHHCLAIILYSPPAETIALAHVFGKEERYGAVSAVKSLLEDMLEIDQSSVQEVRGYLIGELDRSLARPDSRTKYALAAFDDHNITLVHKILGGEMWRDVTVSFPQMLIEEYHEMSKFKYGVYRPERIVSLSL